jgi:hypothetical protein
MHNASYGLTSPEQANVSLPLRRITCIVVGRHERNVQPFRRRQRTGVGKGDPFFDWHDADPLDEDIIGIAPACLDDHRFPHARSWCSLTPRGERATGLKHVTPFMTRTVALHAPHGGGSTKGVRAPHIMQPHGRDQGWAGFNIPVGGKAAPHRLCQLACTSPHAVVRPESHPWAVYGAIPSPS